MNAETISREQAAPESAKKRGRPASGAALSAAERQRRRLEKLEAEGKALLPRVVVSQDVQTALAKFILFKDGMTLGDALDRIVRDRLLRKRSGRHKSRAKRLAPHPKDEQTKA